MFTKIKLIYFLLTWASKLYREYEKSKVINSAQHEILEKIDNETLSLLQEVNNRRKLVGLDELRVDDGFKRT